MIRLYVIAALCAACLATAWFANAQRHRALAAEAALATAEARLDQVAEANAVHRAHLARMDAQRARFEADLTDINTLEGGDAPLSDFLRDVDGRLR